MIDWYQMQTPEVRAARELEQDRETVRALLREWIAETTRALTGDVPVGEMLSWLPKEEAARAWLADTTAPVPGLLAGEAEVTGEEIAALATRVVANADAYRAAQALLTGLRRMGDRLLDAAADPAALAKARATILDEAVAIGRRLLP